MTIYDQEMFFGLKNISYNELFEDGQSLLENE